MCKYDQSLRRQRRHKRSWRNKNLSIKSVQMKEKASGGWDRGSPTVWGQSGSVYDAVSKGTVKGKSELTLCQRRKRYCSAAQGMVFVPSRLLCALWRPRRRFQGQQHKQQENGNDPSSRLSSPHFNAAWEIDWVPKYQYYSEKKKKNLNSKKQVQYSIQNLEVISPIKKL